MNWLLSDCETYITCCEFPCSPWHLLSRPVQAVYTMRWSHSWTEEWEWDSSLGWFQYTLSPCCSVVDMSHNKLEDPAVHEIFSAMEKLVGHITHTCTHEGTLVFRDEGLRPPCPHTRLQWTNDGDGGPASLVPMQAPPGAWRGEPGNEARPKLAPNAAVHRVQLVLYELHC